MTYKVLLGEEIGKKEGGSKNQVDSFLESLDFHTSKEMIDLQAIAEAVEQQRT